jgi:acyl-homoserine lactone acylase PvdQ
VLDPPGTPPGEETRTFYRTVHGPVFIRATVNGKPVAFVKERFFWKRELDSIPQFYRWNAKVDSLSDFRDAARDFTMSFNSFYVDHKHIAYFHVGYYPKRPGGVSPSLPTWGTGKWEWKGRLPFSKHPKIVDPNQGWVTNWNNKPARSWDNYDGAKWGSIHRVELLADQMKALDNGTHNISLSDLVNVIRKAANEDARGIYLGPKMVRWARDLAGNKKRKLDALGRVRKWIKAGAPRLNKDRDENMDDGDAVAIFDAWYDILIHRVYDDEVGAGSYDLLALADAPILDGPSPQGGGYWFDFSSYLYNVFKPAARRPLARNYCDNMKTAGKETCRYQTFKAFATALKSLGEDQGKNMDDWKAPAEWLKFSNFGFGSVPDIPWQNRGTHNQVIEILGKAD